MPSLKKLLEIENVVASSDIEHEVDLDKLEEDLEEPDYEPDAFPGLIYRTQVSDAAILIFRSGKLVCTGAASADEAHQALHVVFDDLRLLGIDIREEPDIFIQNIVANGDLGHQLHLTAIAIGLGLENVEYEPEQFPGLVYRPDDLDEVTLLFGSGKLVITGCRSFEDAEVAFETVRNRLHNLDLLE